MHNQSELPFLISRIALARYAAGLIDGLDDKDDDRTNDQETAHD